MAALSLSSREIVCIMTFQFEGFDHRIHLDFETYSEEDIRSSGAHKYAMHPSTEVLMLAWVVDDDPTIRQWMPHTTPEMPILLRSLLTDPKVAKVAFNAAFERLIFKYVLGMDIPASQWRCTMVCSYYLGFVGSLDQILSQTPLGVSKDPRGQRLIHVFSKPAPKNHHAERYTEEEKPLEWREFCEYNITDVDVERKLLLWLAQFPTMASWDWDRYTLDQEINDRGIFIDIPMAEGAAILWKQEQEDLSRQLRILTGVSRATRGPFTQWLSDQGVGVSTLGREELSSVMSMASTPDHVKRALSLWMQKEGKAAAKYNAMLSGAATDSRVRGMFQFKGASRTDRTAGRRVQLQNLKRSEKLSEAGRELISHVIARGDPHAIHLITDTPVSDVLGLSVRHTITAPVGKTLVVCDLTSIESVVLGWLAQCPRVDETFRAGRDTYKEFAVRYFGVPYEEVTSAQRKFSKPPVLGCGFMLGWKGLIAYAEGYGVPLEEENARKAVDVFRTMYPEIPAFWDWIYKAVSYVILTGNSMDGYRLHIERDADFLRIRLPSGRNLSYYQPQVVRRVAPWATVEIPYEIGNEDPLLYIRKMFPLVTDYELEQRGLLSASAWVDNVSYMGTDLTSRWCRTYAHAGGFTENIVQSIAYDILFNGIALASLRGLPVVLQVHDELGVEVDESRSEGAFNALRSCMTTAPSWADGMWLGAAGYISKRYLKD